MKKILVIDDEKLIRMSLTHCLSGEGYQVDSVSSGIEGIKKLLKGGYDLMITDIRLPDINGDEVIQIAKKISPYVKIIAITAFEMEAKTAQNIKKWSGEIIYKPFPLRKIKDSVGKFLSG